MRWEARWGARIQFLLQLQEQGHKSEVLINRPTRQPEHFWLFEAYEMLSRSRQIGMSEYYIPMTEYAAYLDIVQLTNQEDRSFLVSVLTQVDVVLLHERLQAQEQQQQAA